MRWKISRQDHDPRQIDLLAVVLLLIAIVGACLYIADSTTAPQTTANFIVPSQHVRW